MFSFVGVVAAQAQAVDWFVEIDDTAFENSPAGTTIEYDIMVVNNGNAAGGAPVTEIEFDIPAGTIFTGGIPTPGLVAIDGCAEMGSGNLAPVNGPATITCDVGALSNFAGSTNTAGFMAQVQTTQADAVAVAARVLNPGGVDTQTANNNTTENTTILGGSDLSVSVISPASAAAGDFVTFDWQVENLGPNDSGSFTFDFPIPAGFVNISSVPPGCSLSGGSYTCTVTNTPVGSTVSLPFTGQIGVAGGSNIAAVASISGANPGDAFSGNNTATASLGVTDGTDLEVDIQRSPGGDLLVGDPVTFTVASGFTGDNPTDIDLVIDLGDEYTITSVNDGPYTCVQAAGNVLNCTLASGGGAGANVDIGDIVIQTVANAPGTGVQSTATISADSPTETILSNNTDNDGGVLIEALTIDLTPTKTGPQFGIPNAPSPNRVVTGQPFDFTLNATNLGTAGFTGDVILTDTVPAGMQITNVASGPFSCTPTSATGPATITCTQTFTAGSPLAAGASTADIVLTAVVTSDGPITNNVDVTSNNGNLPDSNPGNNSDSEPVTAESQGADVGVLKTTSATPTASGEIRRFFLEVTNDGPLAAQNIVLEDRFANLIDDDSGPGEGFEGFTIIPNAATGAFTCSDVDGGFRARTLTCNIANLPVCTPGTDCPIVEVDVRPGRNAGTYSNTASAISDTTADPDLSNRTSTVTYDITAVTDVEVSKTASPATVEAGQDLTYQVSAGVVNNGRSAADNVTIVDTLPDGVIFVSATPSVNSCTAPAPGTLTSSDTVTCNLGTINVNAQQTVTIVVRPTNAQRFGVSGVPLTNLVDVTTSTPETTLVNNTFSVDTQVNDPDLELLVNKDDNVDPVAVGDQVIYTLVVDNLGPSASENVIVRDTLPPSNIAFNSVSFDNTTGNCVATIPTPGAPGGTVECTFPYLAAGDSETIDITFDALSKGTVNNFVEIDSDEIDPLSPSTDFERLAGNNTNTENTTIRSRGDLAVTRKEAIPSTVSIFEVFDWEIDVENLTAAGRAEIDEVELTDNLPANMEIAGPITVAVNAGNATSTACTGAVGAGSFTCDFGTMDLGTNLTVTVPARVTSITTSGQVFSNTASATTSSLDEVSTNNSETGTVSVIASSIAGNVFFDFMNDGVEDGSDFGVEGVVMTLTGMAIDGSTINRTVTTDPVTGEYLFDLLPEGTYVVTRGGSPVPGTDGAAQPGSESGTATNTQISAINLPGGTDATEYNFPIIPDASIGIAKEATGAPVTAADGSFVQTFTLTVENFSQEPVLMEVTDPLTGAAPLFGNFVNLGAPATDAMTAGSYTIVAAPSGSCGGTNAAFNGAGDIVVATGFTLARAASCNLVFEVRVQPTAPLPPVLASGGRYENQATVDGEGTLTGQTSATNPNLRDLSDDGTEPDANDDDVASGGGEDDPTPVIPNYAPSIALIKTANIMALSNPVVAGDIVTFNFEVTNTGDVDLSNVTVTDILPGVNITGSPIASLPAGGAPVTISGTYELTQPDVDLGTVTNQATAEGTDPFGTVVDDPSGSTLTDDTPLVTSLTPAPAIRLIKSADASGLSNPPVEGEFITYTFTVTNIGNVSLTGVSITDLLPDIELFGGPIASMEPGDVDTDTFTARYALKQSDINLGFVENSATVSGTAPDATIVTDDSGTDNSSDAPTVVPLTQGAAISLVKTADDSATSNGGQVGDQITYTFTITNTGNVTLNNVTLTDSLPGLVLVGSPIPTMEPGDIDTLTYSASYAITQADIDNRGVQNTATVEGFFGPGNASSVTDDDVADAFIGTIEAIPEVFPPFTTDGGTTTSMLASDTLNGDPVTLSTVTITVLDEDPGVTLDPITGLITLAPGQPAGSYEVEYRITSIDFPDLSDTTIETVVQGAIPAIETTKTQSELIDDGDGVDSVGDRIDYVITVENTGNVDLTSVALIDTLTDINGGALTLTSGPTFDSSDNGSPEGSLAIGETATYLASFTIDVQALAAGGVSNTVTATGTPNIPPGIPGDPAPVSDVSDDGIDNDGDTQSDPTVRLLAGSTLNSGLNITKTTPREIVERGSVVSYTITVTNTNAIAQGSVQVTDSLPANFLYVPGSSSLPNPTVTNGRLIVWDNIVVPANGSVSIDLSARILNGASAGDHVNSVVVTDPATGAALTLPATATVRILPEAVFDCGDVIGKVFEDHNGNGYQDDPNRGSPRITDQDFLGGKGGKAETPRDLTEKGIPGVRLATVDGLIITTDQNGLYSIPCASLPNDRGSNFIVKLDTRSLPTGYRMTTENPRVVRLTPGMMSEMNFGAAITRVVRVDLNAAGFEDGAPGTALLQGLDGFLPSLAGELVTIRLAYHLPRTASRGDIRDARKDMRALERHIKRSWRNFGRTRLGVEQTIVRASQ
jgi:uncharacterized repeat protein (TIGR01451 family)/fimbrial isopeptide formation D2 family protein